MNNRTRRIATTLTTTAIVCLTGGMALGSTTDHDHPRCEEDQACWIGSANDNRFNPPTRVHPTHIEGHWMTGWHITWSDGHKTAEGGWEDIVRECHHDDHPQVCLTAWRVHFSDLGLMRAILRSQ